MATTSTPVDRATVEEMLTDWPEEPTGIAEDVVDRYGWPDEPAPSELRWDDDGQRKRTEVYRDGSRPTFRRNTPTTSSR